MPVLISASTLFRVHVIIFMQLTIIIPYWSECCRRTFGILWEKTWS